jgi:hypothetical protein
MIVTMRPGIEPLCDKCLCPMPLSQFSESPGLTAKVFKCGEPGCTRAYVSSMGYFDIVNDQFARQKHQQICPEDGTPMFMDAISPEHIETWRCAQIGCDHSVRFPHDSQARFAN